MPHKCARCQKIYPNDAKELFEGCPCGSRLFLFLKDKGGGSEKEAIEKLKKSTINESDLEWLDREFGDKLKQKGTIRLDIETMTRTNEGKFTLDIASLMKGGPIVVKAEEGVYYIDLPYSMKKKENK